MKRIQSQLTVFFEEPFWVGVYEKADEDGYQVCRIVFGAEPKDYEIYQFMMENWEHLRFSPPIPEEKRKKQTANPKRMQREVRKQLQNKGASTKAQQALKIQQEQGKAARKIASRQKKEAEKEAKFQMRQQKKKKKHRGH